MPYEIKPCPFCGEVPVPTRIDHGPFFGFWSCVHRCPEMGYFQIFEPTEERLIPAMVARWNTRAVKK
jgi:hypothetical protein